MILSDLSFMGISEEALQLSCLVGVQVRKPH